jgi:hypothetical protein
MNQSSKTLWDMVLSTSICACYAVPEVGAVMGGGLAIGQFFLDWLNPAPQGDPGDWPASSSELKAAVDEIESAFDKQAFAKFRSDIGSANDAFQGIWQQITMKRAPSDTQADWDYAVQQRNTDCNQYFVYDNSPTGTKNTLDTIRLWLEPMLDTKNPAVSLYALVGTLAISYHRNAADWQVRVKLDGAANDQFAYSDYLDAYATWGLTRKGTAPATVANPGTPITPAAATVNNDHFKWLYNTLLPAYIQNAQKQHDRWKQSWSDYDNDLATRQAALAQQNPQLSKMQLDALWGQQLTYLAPALQKQYNIADLTRADSEPLQQTIDNWVTVQKELGATYQNL